MKRRAFLGASAVSLPLSGPGSIAAARSTPVTTRQEAYAPLGRVPVDRAAEVVVGDDGETAYVATVTGFATVDVSDPADPAVLAEEREVEIDGEGVAEILDVSVAGDRLVVAGPGNPGDGVMGFCIYDVSDPADPVPVGEYETGYHIHNCTLEGDLLFVPENTDETNALAIFDVADEITRVGSWSLLDREPGWRDRPFLGRYLHDVSVQDGVAYLPYWNAGTYLIDVSDPNAPEYVSHVADTTLAAQREIDDRDEAVYGLPGNDHYAAVDDTGDLMAVGREAWATGGADPDRPGGIDLYDVSDPAEPDHRGSIDPPRVDDETYRGGDWTTSHNFELRDDRLYSSWYRGGVKIHDVSDPSEPEELAWWRDAEKTAFWTAQVLGPGDTFVASSTEAIPNTSLDGALYTFPIESGTNVADDGFGSDSTENDSQATDSESDDSEADDSIPGFTGLAGLAGGALALEWLRRNVQD